MVLLFIYKGLHAAIRNLTALMDRWHNASVLKSCNISCKTSPDVRGRLYMSNQGKITIGDKAIFNSRKDSNWAGINKPCSIGVAKGGILTIGNHCGFSGVSIFCSQRITIGNYVNCGVNVFIWDTDFHPLHFEERRIHDVTKISAAPVLIGDDVFIGANCTILKGVTIGERAVIGAGSVVTRDIPADEIWAGNPAKFIRRQDV